VARAGKVAPYALLLAKKDSPMQRRPLLQFGAASAAALAARAVLALGLTNLRFTLV
jgi:hypothetical protein